jgi:hypothetical protein
VNFTNTMNALVFDIDLRVDCLDQRTRCCRCGRRAAFNRYWYLVVRSDQTYTTHQHKPTTARTGGGCGCPLIDARMLLAVVVAAATAAPRVAATTA